MSAVISDCLRYRYMLERQWGSDKRIVVWIMLNPSTADAATDDNTIRKCRKFSDDWGYGAMRVVNLYAWRATDPNKLWDVDDPVGGLNDYHIKQWTKNAHLIVCAWGKSGPRDMRPDAVKAMLKSEGLELHYLKLNKDGNPGHPLYLPGSLLPKVWQ